MTHRVTADARVTLGVNIPELSILSQQPQEHDVRAFLDAVADYSFECVVESGTNADCPRQLLTLDCCS
jgi:hypothetical protein